MKQYYSEYRDFTFKTLDTGLQAAEYTVTCISGAVEIGTIDYTYGDGATLAPIEREGYEFMGWHLLPDLNDPVIESIDAAIGGNITVYCEYKVANYSITYYDGDTKIENDDWDQSYTMSQYIPLPEAEDMAKEGYTFDGWYTTPDFSGDPVTAIEMGSTGDKVFYAKYTAVGGGDAGGCSGSVIGVSSGIIGLCALGAVAVMIKRKRRAADEESVIGNIECYSDVFFDRLYSRRGKRTGSCIGPHRSVSRNMGGAGSIRQKR